MRTLSSLVVVDSPGFQNPATCGRQTGANFEDLCCNYLHERMQLLYHETTLTAPQDRYSQVSTLFPTLLLQFACSRRGRIQYSLCI